MHLWVVLSKERPHRHAAYWYIFLLRLLRRMPKPDKISCCVCEVDLDPDFTKQAAYAAGAGGEGKGK